jgi:hypothetical protein
MASSRLPSGIHSTNRQYKHHCQHIVRWIVTTSGSLLSNNDAEGSQPHPNSASASKGSRKKKKSARQKRPRTDRYAPKVTLNQLIKLSKLIATNDISTPEEILYRLYHMIQLRKEVAAFFSTDTDAGPANKSHQKTIEIFLQVYSILGGSSSDDEQFTKMIGGLNLGGEIGEGDVQISKEIDTSGTVENEWIRDNPLVNPAPKRKHSEGARTYALAEYKLIDDEDETLSKETRNKLSREEELFFGVLCFFKDLWALRDYCKSLWKNVEPVGNVSRIAASFVSNQAIDIIRQLEYDLSMDFPELKSSTEIYSIVSGAMQERVADQFKDIANDWAMLYIYCYLVQFSEILTPNHAPLAKVCLRC